MKCVNCYAVIDEEWKVCQEYFEDSLEENERVTRVIQRFLYAWQNYENQPSMPLRSQVEGFKEAEKEYEDALLKLKYEAGEDWATLDMTGNIVDKEVVS